MMQRSFFIVLIIVAGYILISSNISGLYIYALDEAKNAECAREMLKTGNWIVPTFNYDLRTDKPPLHYYFMMLSYSVFGVNEFAARFFSVVMGVLTLLITYLFSSRFLDPKSGMWATIVLFSSLHYVLQFHMAVPDPYLIFFTTAALMSFYRAQQEDSKKFLFLFYLAMGLGVLTKGPVAIALPGLILLLFLLFTKKFSWPIIKWSFDWRGILLFLLVAVPWYVAVHIKTNGEWTSEFFLKHNIGRYTSEMEGHGGIFLLTFAFVLVGLLPFSIFIIQGIKKGWHDRQNPVVMLSLIASTSIIGFFAISSTKLPNYTVPAYPFLAILIGYWISQTIAHFQTRKASIKISLIFYLIFSIIFVVAAAIALKNDKYLSHLSFLWYYLLVLPLGASAALWFFYRSKINQAFISVALSFVVLSLLFFHIIFAKIDRENPVAQLMPKMNLERPVAGYRFFNPAFIFYLDGKVPRLENPEEVRLYLESHPDAYIITRSRYLETLLDVNQVEVVMKSKDIFESPTTVILQLSN